MPVTDLINVKQDGTGAALGQAILGKLATTDGMDKYRLQEFQSYYQSSLDAANKDAGKIEGRQSFDNFNANLHPNLQTVFDGIVKGSGDLYTKAHPFGNDPASDNEYGKRLGLTPDVTPPGSQTNPGANLVSYNTNGNGSGTVALYTDPAKLAKIHELKQIDLLSKGLNLPLDIATITTMIANGQDPLGKDSILDGASQDNLRKINKARGWIQDIGGDNASVTFMPTVYTSPSQGVQLLNLLRVEGDKNHDGVITHDATTRSYGRGGGVTLPDEDMIIDTSMLDPAVNGQNVAWKYSDFNNYQKDNSLDDHGKLYLATADANGNMLLHVDPQGHVDNINFNGVDAAITTTWEHIRRWGDVIVGTAGLVAGVALTLGTGGLAAPLVAGAAALWFGMRTVETADEMSDHGQSFNPINTHADGAWFGFIDPTAGGLWLGAIASASGLAELRPLALAGSLSRIGEEATLADQTLLASRFGTTSSEYSRGFWTNMVGGGPLKRIGLGEGLQTNIYRARLAGPANIASKWAKLYPKGLAWTAKISGGALTAGQGQSFYQMAASGQIDLTNWGINSSSWDFAMIGGGVATMGLGFMRGRALKARAEAMPALDSLPNRISVRDPVSGDVVEATVPMRLLPQAAAFIGDDGIIDSAYIKHPDVALADLPAGQHPRWHLVGDGGEHYLLPIIAGGSQPRSAVPGSGDPFAWSSMAITEPPAGEAALFLAADLPVLNQESDHGALPPESYVHVVGFDNPTDTLDHGQILRTAQVNDRGQIDWQPDNNPIPLDPDVHFVVTPLDARTLQSQMQPATAPHYAVYDRAAGWIPHSQITDMHNAGTLDAVFPPASAGAQSVNWLPVAPSGQEWLYRGSDLSALEQASSKGALPPGRYVHAVRIVNPTDTLDHGQVLRTGHVNDQGQIEWSPGKRSIPLRHNVHFVVTDMNSGALQARMKSATPPSYAVYDGTSGWIPHDDIAARAAAGTLDTIFPKRSGTSPTWTPTPQAPLSGANDRAYPPVLWENTAKPGIFQGYFRSDDVLHVYAVARPNNPTAGDTLSFTHSDIHAHGIVRPGAWDVEWQFGHNQAKDILGQFGEPPANQIWAFAISRSSPFDIQQAGGLNDIPWHLDPNAIPGPVGGADYQEPIVGRSGAWRSHAPGALALVEEQFRSVQIVRNTADRIKQAMGKEHRPEAGWVPEDSPQSRNAYSLPRRSIAQVGKATIPMDDKESNLAAVDAHNHTNSFPQPYYLELAKYVNRVRRVVAQSGTARPGLINSRPDDVRLAFTAQPVPYATRRGGAWSNYTELDTATVYVGQGHMNDWVTLSQYEKLGSANFRRW